MDFIVITEKLADNNLLEAGSGITPYRSIVTGSITERGWDGSYTVQATGTIYYNKYTNVDATYYNPTSYNNYASSVSSEATVTSIKTNYWDFGGWIYPDSGVTGTDSSGLDYSHTRTTSLTSPYTYYVNHNRYYLDIEYNNLRQDITINWSRGSGSYTTSLSVALI